MRELLRELFSPGNHKKLVYNPLLNFSVHAIVDQIADVNASQWRIQDFPQGGAPTPKRAIIFQFFSRKLHENEGIWTPGGGGRVPGAAP